MHKFSTCKIYKSYNSLKRNIHPKPDRFQPYNSNEQLKLALEIYLEDYKLTSEAGNNQINLTNQIFSLTLAVLAALLGAAPIIIQFEYSFLIFAFFSFVFYGLSLSQLRHAFAVMSLNEYCSNILVPSIREILKSIAPSSSLNFDNVLSWPSSKSRSVYFSKIWEFPIEARYLLPVVAGISTCLAYWFTSPSRILWLDISVVGLNIFCSLYIIIVGLVSNTTLIKSIK